MRFWDASALVPLLVAEKKTDVLRRMLEADPTVVVWWATPVECASALAKQNREGSLSDSSYLTALDALVMTSGNWRPVTPSQHVRYEAMRFVRIHALKAADALQLAAAVEWAERRAGGLQFVSLDKRLRNKALLEGFTILPLDLPSLP